jgi:hypothetical protein
MKMVPTICRNTDERIRNSGAADGSPRDFYGRGQNNFYFG